MGGVRWAFPCAAWRPRRREWLLAARLVQPEEKDRIGRFVFARDAKAALVHSAGGRGGGAAAAASPPPSPAAPLRGRDPHGPRCPEPLVSFVPAASAASEALPVRGAAVEAAGRCAEEPPVAPLAKPGPARCRGDAVVPLPH